MAKAYKDDITTRDDSGPITSPEMQFNITKDEKRGWERPRRKQKTDDLSRDTRDTTSNTRDTRVDPGSLRGFDSTQEGSVPPAAPFPPTDDTSAKKGKARRTTGTLNFVPIVQY